MEITIETRRDIIQSLINKGIRWAGDLHDVAFLSRIYPLKTMPSKDSRCDNAESDIYMHRVHFHTDWDGDWIYDDDRFKLREGPDEEFLRFLCEMVHPLVRGESGAVDFLVILFNDYLREDGYELVELKKVARRPVYTWRKLGLPGATSLAALRDTLVKLDGEYLTQQLKRMEDAIEKDPWSAIGTAKDLIESSCRTVLKAHGEDVSKNTDLPELMKATTKLLGLAPDDIPDHGKAAHTIKRLLHNLCTVANGLAELRNSFGTGHGKPAASKGLSARHAKLAAGAAVTLSVFLLETHADPAAKKKRKT